MQPRYSVLTGLVLLGLLVMLPRPSVAQTEVTLAPVQDNTLYEDDSGALSNGAGSHLFAGTTNGGDIRRALLKFDVAAELPEGAQVEAVQLQLHMSKTATGAQPVALHRVLADWGEGSSAASGEEGGGASATTNDATWIHRFYDSATWETPGGDFPPEASATLEVDDVGSYTWASMPELVADVQAWLDAPDENFGWILIGNESTNRTAKRFDSREHATEANRPMLSITYTMGTAIEDSPAPLAFRLDEVYPNPFGQTTTVLYVLDTPTEVSLDVFDVLGRRVARLAEGIQPAGRHAARFEAGALPDGMYHIRLRAGATVQHRQVVLIR